MPPELLVPPELLALKGRKVILAQQELQALQGPLAQQVLPVLSGMKVLVLLVLVLVSMATSI